MKSGTVKADEGIGAPTTYVLSDTIGMVIPLGKVGQFGIDATITNVNLKSEY